MWNLAQYSYGTPTNSASGGFPAVLWVVYAVFIVVSIVAYWKIFTKAGQAGWKSIIPIYSSIIMLRIVGMSGWYVLLFLVPIVNIVFAIILAYKVAQAFGYGVGMTILEFIFGVGLLIIAFGDSKYSGPEGPTIADTPYPKNSNA